MLTLIALSITAAAAIAYAVRCRREVAATIYRLTVALDEARRLLDDPRARGKCANRTAWELERQAWREATR